MYIKIKVMKIFLIIIRDYPIEFGVLESHLLEIESLSHVVNLFASLYVVDTLIQSLLRVMVTILFFTLLYKDFKKLVIPS